MARDYVLVVAERDQERFRRFRTGYDKEIIKSIDQLCDAGNVWALGPSTSHDLWSGIQKDDRIFFAEMGMSFRHCGIVLSKVTSQMHAIKIWGDSPRMREHKRLILFSAIYDIDVSFNKLCKEAGINPSSMSTNIYLAEKKIDGGPKARKTAGMIIVSDDGAPNKKSEVVTRFIRNTRKVKQIKTAYHNECQICGRVIETSDKTRYSEVHHLHPLGDGGDDDFDNMLVLCPTHHVEFDYKVIGIDGDKKTIIDKNGNKIGIITMAKEHKLNEKNIRFHLMEMNDELS